MGDPATGTAIVTIAAKLVNPIGHCIVRPIARRCPFKNLWEYKSNLENLKTELKNLEDKRESVRGLTYAGVEPQPDVNDWLDNATNIVNEVLGLISKDNPERGCCEGCTYSNLKGSYQHRNNVARKLKDVDQLLQEAMRFISSWKYKSNLENLKKQEEMLKAKRDRVKCSIEAWEEPLPDVNLWQDKVNSIIDEVRLINENNLEHQNNPEQQNKVAQVLRDVDGLLQEEAQFKGYSYQPIPKQTCLQPSTQQEFSESRASILKDIIAALRNTDINMVGIHGIGGVGKTTLAKKVEIQAMQDTLFDKIVFVEVSQSPDIRNIQGVIADYLGLRLEEETESGRAMKLCDVLKKEKKTILIILDNLWKGIKLGKVGIPFGNDCKGLKLLLTARSRNVLIKGMDSQHNFHVEALSAADAWILFKSIAGTCVDHPHLKTTAIQVAKKCGGMPLAIVTVAKALKDEAQEQWQDALRSLSNPSSESFEGITEEIYNSIKLSYDYLHEKLKGIFLLCSRMGCTYDASVQDLFRYGLGLGFFNEIDTVEDALRHVYASVDQLKAASLLLDAPDKFFHRTPVCERFAIHDVICAVARSIASKDQHLFTVLDDRVPQSLKNENKLEHCTSITLCSELPKDLKLVCPQLKFLYVKPRLSLSETHSKISDKFFAAMPNLQVLHLIQMDLRSTPLSDLVNLRTLCLECCKLTDIADIGKLKNLEIFSFRCCKVLKLPKKLPQLAELRLLELDRIGQSSIPSEFILSSKKLEALYMGDTTIKWEVEKSNNGSRNASHGVLEHLSNLTSLEICVPDATMLRGFLSPKLERYSIRIGEMSFPSPCMRHDWDIQRKTSRFLRVKRNTNGDGIISGLKPIRQLVLDEVPGIANNFCGLDRMGFPELEDLLVQNNSHILHIVDTVSGDGAFPILKSLILWNLINLKTICNGSLGMKLFQQLRTIKVGKCRELTNLFSFASERVFQELEEIEVEHCEKMKEIFAISEQVHDIKFSKLRILRLTSLPQLESLCCNVETTTPVLQFTSDRKPEEIILEEEQDVSKPLFNDKVVVTNLETLEINNINVKWIWDNQLPTMANIPNLTCLIISNLANLRRLGSGDYIQLPSLKEMTIESCPQFKELFFDDKVRVPSLKKINIFKMDNLKMIWHNQLAVDSFSKLKSLQVQKCQMLLTLFPSNMYGSFVNLETINVSECGSLEEILDLRGINSEESHPTTSTQSGELCIYSPLVLSFANLQNLNVSKCQKLKTLFSTSIVAKEEGAAQQAPATARFIFAKLSSLKLYELPELRTFYPGRYITEWPVLKAFTMNQLGIDGPNLQRQWQLLLQLQRKQQQPQKQVGFEFQVGFLYQFQVGKIWPNLLWTMSSWVQSLTRLIVHGCGNLEELFPYSMIETKELREKKTGNTIVFPKLYYLEMEQLANLKGLCSECHIEFPILSEFKISNCPELTAFIFNDKVKVPNLKELKISSMDNLKMIWDNQLNKNSIPKLKSMQVKGCNKMLTLLQGNMCYQSFLSLKTLDVSDCDSLEEMFDLHEIKPKKRRSTRSTPSQELNITTLNFSCLEMLKVSECRSLKSLFSIWNVAVKEPHATAKFIFQKMTSLKLSKLPQLKTFYPARYEVVWRSLSLLQLCDCGISDIDNEDQMQHLLFLVEKAVPCLKKLILSGSELMMMWQGQDPEPLFQNFKILEVLDESKADNLLCESQPVLHYIGDVKCMWKQNFKLDLILPNFEKIVVGRCDILISLMPPSASFRSLTSLEVNDCNSLEHIGTFSMAKNLVKLVSLGIYRCKKIVEVLRNHEDVTGDKILFSNLNRLSLEDLPSLTSFCSWNFTLEFPCLEELNVHGCPNMKIFSQGELTTPKLHKVKSGWRSINLCLDVDVNTAIQQFHEQKVCINSLS